LIHLDDAAWQYATSPDAERRNGAYAVELAEGACELTQYQQTFMVCTLAAAYAETGRFERRFRRRNEPALWHPREASRSC